MRDRWISRKPNSIIQLSDEQRSHKSLETMLRKANLSKPVQRVYYLPCAYLPLCLFEVEGVARREMAKRLGLQIKEWAGVGMTVQGLLWPEVHLIGGQVIGVKREGPKTKVDIRTGEGRRAWAMCYGGGLDAAREGEELVFFSLSAPRGNGLVQAQALKLGEWPTITPVYETRSLLLRPEIFRAWQRALSVAIQSYVAEDAWANALHRHALAYYRASLSEILTWLHFPPDGERHRMAQSFIAACYHATSRMLFRDALDSLAYPENPLSNHDIKGILEHLEGNGIRLTDSQRECAMKLSNSLRRPRQMRALLFGETGSGKSLVSFCLGLAALKQGVSVLYLAPTRVLTEQQMENFIKVSQGLLDPDRICLWTAERKQQASSTGCIHFATHAAFNIGRNDIGMIFVDEEQKFSADQRRQLAKLSQDGKHHLIRISATPSLETWEMAKCGLIESVHLRRAKPKIFTELYASDERAEAYRAALQASAGGMLVVVCPHIGDRATVLSVRDGQAVDAINDAAHRYGTIVEALAFWRTLGLSHPIFVAFSGAEGDLESVLGQADKMPTGVLFTTNLLETGLNIPTQAILVERAESFGISQLHQMRGRLTRIGADKVGRFVLVSGMERDTPSYQRLSLLVDYEDAIQINEVLSSSSLPSVLPGAEGKGAWRHRPMLCDWVSEEEVEAMTRAMGAVPENKRSKSLNQMFGVTPAAMLA